MPQSKYSEDVRQHLSFIQGVITRMNTNSFSMKGWMVAIVSALCAVYASNSTADAAYVYIIAAIIAASHLSRRSASARELLLRALAALLPALSRVICTIACFH